MGAGRTGRRRRRFGQHFLTDPRVADRIIEYAELEPTDHVLEIGPGHGVLTQRMAGHVARLVALEIDAHLVEGLRSRNWERVEVVQGDATEFDYAAAAPIDKVVANLPYSVSSPITFRLLPMRYRRCVLMYQREFADRLVAKVGSDAYGRLAAHAAYYASVRVAERVPRTAFVPPPEVDSSILVLTPHAKPAFDVGSPQSYDALLRALFSTRRKKIRSTLRREHAGLGHPSWDRVEAAITRLGVADRRPEDLAPAELGALDRALWEARRA